MAVDTCLIKKLLETPLSLRVSVPTPPSTEPLPLTMSNKSLPAPKLTVLLSMLTEFSPVSLRVTLSSPAPMLISEDFRLTSEDSISRVSLPAPPSTVARSAPMRLEVMLKTSSPLPKRIEDVSAPVAERSGVLLTLIEMESLPSPMSRPPAFQDEATWYKPLVCRLLSSLLAIGSIVTKMFRASSPPPALK